MRRCAFVCKVRPYKKKCLTLKVKELHIWHAQYGTESHLQFVNVGVSPLEQNGNFTYRQFNIHISTFCPHTVFTCFVWTWEQKTIISLYSINWLVCITETECVYCAVRTGSWYKAQYNLRLLKHRSANLVVGRRLFTAEVRDRSQNILCRICGAQSNTGTGFSPNNSVLPS
jgi:hypothetical protein